MGNKYSVGGESDASRGCEEMPNPWPEEPLALEQGKITPIAWIICVGVAADVVNKHLAHFGNYYGITSPFLKVYEWDSYTIRNLLRSEIPAAVLIITDPCDAAVFAEAKSAASAVIASHLYSQGCVQPHLQVVGIPQSPKTRQVPYYDAKDIISQVHTCDGSCVHHTHRVRPTLHADSFIIRDRLSPPPPSAEQIYGEHEPVSDTLHSLRATAAPPAGVDFRVMCATRFLAERKAANRGRLRCIRYSEVITVQSLSTKPALYAQMQAARRGAAKLVRKVNAAAAAAAMRAQRFMAVAAMFHGSSGRRLLANVAVPDLERLSEEARQQLQIDGLF
eukprot:TRINITY_DN5572_c0_g1_i1.p1 TRINITY_DN5572_c0_g1~~TRINITY_DN5572_c0_g1_i1.p1  ORF type:complete len:374 (+),score=46.02 TRINITY_DN5572_c0_g1_i1:122-1123(+)